MKNIHVLVLSFLLFLSTENKAQVIISMDEPLIDSSAYLEVKSDSLGWLIPRMTAAQRDEIQNPAAGLMIYNLDAKSIEYYNSSSWVNVNQSVQLGLPCGDKTLVFNGLTYGTVFYRDRCWLDRNLGAVKTADSITDLLSHGYLYQWGRLTDGHQLAASQVIGALADSVVPGHAKFILPADIPFDWLVTPDPNLWQSHSNYTNNPCPDGWKIPNREEWFNASEGWATIIDAFNSPLKLPGPGNRYWQDGTHYSNGSGCYWSATHMSNLAYQQYFDVSTTAQYHNYRSWGFSVRCIEIEPYEPVFLFSRAYGGEGTDEGWAIDRTADGGFLLAGLSRSFGDGSEDFLYLKVDSAGWFEHGKVFDDGGLERCNAVMAANDNGIIMTGRAFLHAYTLKLDSSGNIEWEEKTNWPSGATYNYDVIQDQDSNFIFVGHTSAFGAGGYDLRVSKRDFYGNPIWGYAYGTENQEYGYALIMDTGGDIVTAGSTDGGTLGGYNFHFQKIGQDGSWIFGYYIGGPGDDQGRAIVQSDDLNYVMAGYTDSFGAGGYDYYIRQVGPDGSGWGTVVGGPATDLAYSLVKTHDNGFAIAGSTSSFGAGGQDMYLVKLDSNGFFQWSWAFGSEGYEVGREIVMGDDGSLYVIGTAINTPFGNDVIIVKFAADGSSCLGYFCDLPTDSDNISMGMNDAFTATPVETVSILRLSGNDHCVSIRPVRTPETQPTKRSRTTTAIDITPIVTTICQ